MSYESRANAAKMFGGANTYFGENSSNTKGPHAQFPASIPKYAIENTLGAALETGFRLYLPAKYLLKSNPRDADVLAPLVNNQYINFIVEDVQIDAAERVEVKRLVNGAFATYFFGTDPPNFVFSGTVLNDFQADWANDLLRLYFGYIRGTRLAKRGKQLIASYNDRIVFCECLSVGEGLTGAGETHARFTLRTILHKMTMRINPIVSDFQTKDAPSTTLNTGAASDPKKTTVAIRSDNPADVITQKTFTNSELDSKKDALRQQESDLRSAYIITQTRAASADQALNAYTQNNPGDEFSSTGLALLAAKQAADADVSSAQRAIRENASQQKQLSEGAILRDTDTRPRSGSGQATPSRVIVIAYGTPPQVNRNLTQEVA